MPPLRLGFLIGRFLAVERCLPVLRAERLVAGDFFAFNEARERLRPVFFEASAERGRLGSRRFFRVVPLGGLLRLRPEREVGGFTCNEVLGLTVHAPADVQTTPILHQEKKTAHFAAHAVGLVMVFGRHCKRLNCCFTAARMSFVGFCLVAAAACDSAPAEPQATPAPKISKQRKSLRWTVPPSWSLVKSATRGKYRAKYSLPAQGSAAHPAELLIHKVKKPEQELKRITASFDPASKPTIQRGSKEVRGMRVEWVDVLGTYKFPVGPPIPRGKRKGQHAAHMLKKDWQTLAATVVSKEQGRWLLHVVGPKDTVSAARSSFFNFLDSLN